MSNRIVGDYDRWKTASPYDNESETATVEVDLSIFPDDPDEDIECVKIKLEVPVTEDGWERETYIDEDDVIETVAERFAETQYKINNWKEI